MKPRILVTGAAGRTGAPAVAQLRAAGFPVRAMVRRRDARSAALERLGAEVVVGDLWDYRDLQRALEDVQRGYHCPPFAPNLLHGAMLFALAAQEARLEVVALMSGWNPHPTHPALVTREHWLANNVYRWMPDVDVVHINPGLFASVYLLPLPMAVHFGMLPGSFGDGLNAPPASEDIAAVAAHVLMDPGPHLGRSYRPTGPALLSGADIADVLSTVLGRKVTYREVSDRMFAKAARAQGFPLFEIAQVRHYAAEVRGGTFATGAPNDHVLEVTGRAPEAFESTARRYVADPSLVYPGLQVGTRSAALSLAMRTAFARVPDLDRWEQEQGFPVLADARLAHDVPEWRAAAEQGRLDLLHDRAPA